MTACGRAVTPYYKDSSKNCPRRSSPPARLVSPPFPEVSDEAPKCCFGCWMFAACWSALSLSYAVEDKAPVPAPTEAAKKLGGSIDGYRLEFACKMALMGVTGIEPVTSSV